MAKMTVTGIDTFTSQLTRLAQEADKINRGALGEGAGYVADQIGQAIDSIPVRDESTHPHKLYGATESELSQIKNNFGIAKFRSSGGKTETSIGFTGYVDTPSAKFNDHIPTGMLVQCIEYGTEFRQPTHTLSRAIKAVKGQAPQKMQDYMDKEVGKIMK